METLSKNDWQRILSFLQYVYVSCRIDEFPAHILSVMPKLMDAEIFGCSSFSLRDRIKPRHVTFPIAEAGMAAELFTTQRQEFLAHPVLSNYLKSSDGQAKAISDFLSESEFQRREGLYDFFQRFGMKDQMVIYIKSSSMPKGNLLNGCQNFMGVKFGRDRRNFNERDRLILNLIRPHLEQAYQNIAAFTQVKEQLIQLNQATEQVGLIALFIDGKVEWITQKADELLHKYCPLSKLPNSLPDIVQRWINNQILLLTKSSEILSPLRPLCLEQNGSKLTVKLSYNEASGVVYLLLEETQPNSFSLKYLEMLGLTKREAEVLFWVAKDRNTDEISKQLGMSDRTVKKHLENIYRKFGVSTRLGAVMYAFQKLGVVNF